ncbi:hypothetical protein BN946_scf184943.g63 [Trametes cinnabarina]|uniref:Uncharacterized protein n=1 Tax=Pycnoporus cinnabarinus TaxID=5643 RepID=A0A060SHW3_PYCCI|nr:hypothetical protein BN946_scf184943.g63 [Trametes cinnabarina]
MSYAAFDNQACTFVLHLNWVSEYIMLLGPAIFSCLRVYALTGRNKALSGLTLAFGCMPFILNMVTIYAGHVVNEPMPVGCTDEYTLSATATIACTPILYYSTLLILSDVIVMAVTCWSTYKVSKLARSISQPLTLNQVMLENGIVYFLSLTCLNILQVLLNAISLANTAIDTGSYTEEFIDLVTSVLISRFLLNLRATARHSRSFSAPSFITSEAPSSSLPQFVSEFAGQIHSSSSTSQYSFGGDEGETTAESGGEHFDLERL